MTNTEAALALVREMPVQRKDVFRRTLTGAVGDAMHAVLCAAGQNLSLLLRAIAAFLRLDIPTVLAWLRSLYWSCLNLLPGGSPERLRHAT